MFTRFTFIRLFLWEHAAYGQPIPRSPPSVQRAVAGRAMCDAGSIPIGVCGSVILRWGLLAFASPSIPPPATVENWGLLRGGPAEPH